MISAAKDLGPVDNELAARRALIERRRDRFDARAWLWSNSAVPRLRRCCSRAISTDGVGVRWSDTDTGPFAGYSDLDRCGSVWACPVCSAKIAASRAAELSEGFAAWGDKGGGLTFVTLTMRHHKGQRLEDLWNGVASAWAAITRGAAWTGSKCKGSRDGCGKGCKHQLGDKERFGIVGTVRATEVTHGKNGWHVHLHVLVFTNAPQSENAAGDMGLSMFGRWKKRLVKEGFAAPLALHGGLDAQVVSGPAAETKLGEYLAKATYEGAGWETAGGSLKSGQKGGSTPFQILHSATAGDLNAVSLWSEWELVSQGRRQIVWSRGLREKVLGTEKEETDQELAEKAFDGETIGRFKRAGWKIVRRRPGALAGVLESAENGTNPQAATESVRKFVAPWGVEFVEKANEVYEVGEFRTDENGVDELVTNRQIMRSWMERLRENRRPVVPADVRKLTPEQSRHLALMTQSLLNPVE